MYLSPVSTGKAEFPSATASETGRINRFCQCPEVKMKRFSLLLFTLALLALMLLSTACEKDGAIKIHNRTSHNVYTSALGESYTIGGDSTLTIDVSTGTSSIFRPDVGKWVDLVLKGETYQIWDDYESAFVDSTSVRVEAGKTTQVYLDPNRACIKVINQSTQWIKKIIVRRSTVSTAYTSSYDVYLAPGEQWFKPQPPADNLNTYYFIVQIQFENDDLLTFGDAQNVLYADDQFVVIVPIQE